MASLNACGQGLTGPVAGRPICEVKPTRPSFRDRRRHLRTVHTEQLTAVAICVSFKPAAACCSFPGASERLSSVLAVTYGLLPASILSF
jgi:hypothetical protein